MNCPIQSRLQDREVVVVQLELAAFRRFEVVKAPVPKFSADEPLF
jgi:hypothetical protein